MRFAMVHLRHQHPYCIHVCIYIFLYPIFVLFKTRNSKRDDDLTFPHRRVLCVSVYVALCILCVRPKCGHAMQLLLLAGLCFIRVGIRDDDDDHSRAMAVCGVVVWRTQSVSQQSSSRTTYNKSHND